MGVAEVMTGSPKAGLVLTCGSTKSRILDAKQRSSLQNLIRKDEEPKWHLDFDQWFWAHGRAYMSLYSCHYIR